MFITTGSLGQAQRAAKDPASNTKGFGLCMPPSLKWQATLGQAEIDLGYDGHKYSRGICYLWGGIPIQLLHSVNDRFAVSIEGILEFRIVIDDLVKEPGRVVVDDVIFVL